LQIAAERFALPALGRAAERRPTGKMLRRRKLLEICAESPASGARFVSLLFTFGDSLPLRTIFHIPYFFLTQSIQVIDWLINLFSQ